MKIPAADAEASPESADGVWNTIAESIRAIGLTEDVCEKALNGIRGYGNRKAREAVSGYTAALTLALDDCRITLEGLLERLNKTSARINREVGEEKE